MSLSAAPLRASAVAISTPVRVGTPTGGYTGATVQRVAGPIDTTITLLEYAGEQVCLVASHFGTSADDVTTRLQRALSEELDLPETRILIFSSHNHSVPLLEQPPRRGYEENPAPSELTSLGKRFVVQVRDAARRLPKVLEPVTVWHAQGCEGRITYNRKGRRADGSTFLMREEDRVELGKDFRGDIDEEAPVVVLRRQDGSPLTALVQFNGHPVTTYRPEDFVVSGDWPQVACRKLSRHLGSDVPVSFLQGCAGDINSKHMFSGDTDLADRYGVYLAAAYRRALRDLCCSSSPGYDFAIECADVPLAKLPAVSTLKRELMQMQDFIHRTKAGDPDTLTCVGLNFSRTMTPAYRAALVEYILPWNKWAIRAQRGDGAAGLPHKLTLDVYALRLGDVAIVGLPTEPFMGIGRQIRRGSPFAVTIPCGYTNLATGFVGYIPDSPNTGDHEYMSAFHRYTRFLPPFRRPAGDALAHVAVRMLRQFSRRARHDH